MDGLPDPSRIEAQDEAVVTDDADLGLEIVDAIEGGRVP